MQTDVCQHVPTTQVAHLCQQNRGRQMQAPAYPAKPNWAELAVERMTRIIQQKGVGWGIGEGGREEYKGCLQGSQSENVSLSSHF